MRATRGIALAATVLAACGGDDGGGSVDLTQPPVVDVTQPPPQRLSDYNLFAWDPATATYTFNPIGDRVVAYDLNVQLFSDYALKQRAIYVPPDATMTFDPALAFEMPVGSVIIKNFAFPADFRAPSQDVTLVETRLLVRYPDAWRPLPYIWDDAQSDAVLSPAGEVRRISFVDDMGEARTSSYLVPQRNQCQECHARKPSETADPVIVPVGVKARHINRTYDYGGAMGVMNQLDRLSAAGMLVGLPSPTSSIPAQYDFRSIESGGVAAIPAEDVDRAARSYLDINCAHCHDPNGVQGITSQLFLGYDNTDLFRLGVCKRPGSAGAGTGGFEFDIVPGSPDTSILYFRLHTEQVGAMMPLIGRSLTHTRGSELVHAWIAAMPPDDCAGQ